MSWIYTILTPVCWTAGLIWLNFKNQRHVARVGEIEAERDGLIVDLQRLQTRLTWERGWRRQVRVIASERGRLLMHLDQLQNERTALQQQVEDTELELDLANADKQRLRKQAQEQRDEDKNRNFLELERVTEALEAKEELINKLWDRLAAVTKQLYEEKEHSEQQREVLQKEKVQQSYLKDRLFNENEKTKKKIQHIQRQYDNLRDAFKDLSERYTAEQEKNAKLVEELKQKDLSTASKKVQPKETKSVPDSEKIEEQPSVSEEKIVVGQSTSTVLEAEVQPSVSEEKMMVGQSTSTVLEAEVQPSVSEEKMVVGQSTSTVLEAEVQPSVSEEKMVVGQSTSVLKDTRVAFPCILYEPDFDIEVLPALSSPEQRAEGNIRAEQGTGRRKPFWKSVRHFLGLRKKNKKRPTTTTGTEAL